MKQSNLGRKDSIARRIWDFDLFHTGPVSFAFQLFCSFAWCFGLFVLLLFLSMFIGCAAPSTTVTPATSEVANDYRNTRPSVVTEDIVEIRIIPPRKEKKR